MLRRLIFHEHSIWLQRFLQKSIGCCSHGFPAENAGIPCAYMVFACTHSMDERRVLIQLPLIKLNNTSHCASSPSSFCMRLSGRCSTGRECTERVARECTARTERDCTARDSIARAARDRSPYTIGKPKPIASCAATPVASFVAHKASSLEGGRAGRQG